MHFAFNISDLEKACSADKLSVTEGAALLEKMMEALCKQQPHLVKEESSKMQELALQTAHQAKLPGLKNLQTQQAELPAILTRFIKSSPQDIENWVNETNDGKEFQTANDLVMYLLTGQGGRSASAQMKMQRRKVIAMAESGELDIVRLANTWQKIIKYFMS